MAQQILFEEELSSLNFQKLAKKLDVRSQFLYNHF